MTETKPPALAEPAPTLLRRHAAGAESARGVLFTVLGELVLPTGGEAWTSAFIDVFGRLGVEEKAARQALMRTAADNWLSSERVGRRTVWRLTPAAERLLQDGTERIFGFAAVAADWDGQLDDRDRAHAGDRTRRPAHAQDAAALGWVRQRHARRLAEPAQRPRRRGAADPGRGPAAGRLPVHGRVPGRQLAGRDGRHAWDLDELAREYDEFIAAFSGDVSPDPLARVIDLVHAWRRFPWIDPGLPAQFLPAPWSGTAAAEAVRPAARSVGGRGHRRVEAAAGQGMNPGRRLTRQCRSTRADSALAVLPAGSFGR